MASQLAEASIHAQAALRTAITGAVVRGWHNLGSWHDADVERFLAAALPLVSTGQRQAAILTDAYLARAMERQPIGINPAAVIGAASRNGTDPATVYTRPFETLWSRLGEGAAFPDAFSTATARLASTAQMDVQLAMRGAANAVNEADPTMYGFIRVADASACPYCQEIDGAYVKDGDAMALHPACGCTLEPLTAPHPRAAKLPSGVAVHEHGELGAVLGAADHDFTSASDL